MPFKSASQRRWMFENKPEMAKRWVAETPKGRLPERIGSKYKEALRIEKRVKKSMK